MHGSCEALPDAITVDALGNSVTYAYDANSNVTSVTRDDVSTDLGSGPDIYVTNLDYDGLDRITDQLSCIAEKAKALIDSAGAVVDSAHDDIAAVVDATIEHCSLRALFVGSIAPMSSLDSSISSATRRKRPTSLPSSPTSRFASSESIAAT